jgi:hypothetical protein
VLIRDFKLSDLEAVKELHAKSGLPSVCLPDLTNPLFFVKVVAESNGKVVQAGFVKLIGEAYILVDHDAGEPGERLSTLESVVCKGLSSASAKGLSDVSAWLPPDLEKSFGPRLKALGFIRSPWPNFSVLLE